MSLEYNVPADAEIVIELYDAMGRQVATLMNESQTRDIYTLNIDVSSLSSGMYKIRTIMKTTEGTEVYTEQLMIAK